MKNIVIVLGILLSTISITINADCFKTAQKIEETNRNKQVHDSRALDKALTNYLCAAKENNAAAAVRAVQLSRSGMTQKLPPEKEKELLEQANKLGSGVAAHIMAKDACPNGMSNCQNILYAIDMLKVSVKRGDKDAPLLLGVIYERGYGVTSSALKALTCYRLALQGSSSEAAQRNIAGLHLPNENVATELACVD